MKKNIRIIARLDIKNQYLIKGINLEGLRKLGDPNEFATNYYKNGIDEILYLDNVASLYGKNTAYNIIEKTIENTFIPITVGGRIRTIGDVKKILNSGADKIALNSAAIKNPNIIKRISNEIGNQSLVISIETKKIESEYFIFYNNGREVTNMKLVEWLTKIHKFGAGEILVTCIDTDGTMKGFPVDLAKILGKYCKLPLILSGGFYDNKNLYEVLNNSEADGIAIGSALHFKKTSILKIKKFLKSKKFEVRL